MRHEASLLENILVASKRIEAITGSTAEELFLADEVLPAVVSSAFDRDL